MKKVLSQTNILTQDEIDKILSITRNEDTRFDELAKHYYALKNQRIMRFYNFADPLHEYIPYFIVNKNPSIAVEFNKFIKDILVLETKIGNLLDKLRFKKRNEKVDENYEVLLLKLKNSVKEYEGLVLKYLTLNDLKKELLKNQKQR